MKASEIFRALQGCKFMLVNEKELQVYIHKRLLDKGIHALKEFRLSRSNIIDLYYDGVGIEIKIYGSAKEIYRQCERYTHFNEIKSLILVTNRSMGFPAEINSKPCYVLNLGKAWL